MAADLDYPTPERCLSNATDADPLLGPLRDNGGPAPTMDLPAGSPALDQVQATGLSTCAPVDERGVHRPVGPLCDIGAVERSAPSATTGAASALTTRGAHLAGAANPGQLPATYRFDYGKSYVYTAQSKATALAAGSAAVPVVANLAGLQPGTLYHYRLTVTNPDGVATGSDRTFRTKPAPDHTPPKLGLSGPRTQALAHTVVVDVDPIDEVCTVAASGNVVVQTAAGKKTTFALASATDELGTGGRTVLRPGIPKAARDAAAAALAHGGSATAHLKVVATDTAGNRTTKTRDVKLTAPHAASSAATR